MLSFAALAAAAAEDEPEADDEDDEPDDDPSEPSAEEEVGDAEAVPLDEADAPGRVRLEPLPYGAEPEIPVAEGRPVAAPVAFEGATGDVGAEPSLADESVPELLVVAVVLTSVSPIWMDSYEPVRSP